MIKLPFLLSLDIHMVDIHLLYKLASHPQKLAFPCLCFLIKIHLPFLLFTLSSAITALHLTMLQFHIETIFIRTLVSIHRLKVVRILSRLVSIFSEICLSGPQGPYCLAVRFLAHKMHFFISFQSLTPSLLHILLPVHY